MKRITSVSWVIMMFSVVALFIVIFTLPASAETEGYYTYSISGGKATITGVDADINGDITIPAKLGGYTVSEIGETAFFRCINITSIKIPDSVTDLGVCAFGYCENLESVQIGNGVENIGSDAFFSCKKLKNVNIPNGITKIDIFTFYECESLESINIPNTVTNIDRMAFSDCKSLKSIFLSGASIEIGSMAFRGCTELVTLDIQNNNAVIGDFAFAYCTSLKNVNLDNNVTSIGLSAFFNCASIESITILQDISRIDDEAFSYCTSLKSVVLPSNIEYIGTNVFSGCTSLEKIHCSTGSKAHEYAVANSINTEACLGGTATCTQKAKCTVCNNEYGELAEHDFSVAKKNISSHWNKCAKCNATDVKQAHTFGEDNKCTICEFQNTVVTDNNSAQENTDNNQANAETTDIKSNTSADSEAVGGCGSVIGGKLSIVALLGLLAVFTLKKKKFND